MSRNVDMFQNAKRLILSNPSWGDEQVADAMGERLEVCGQIIQTARKDLAADVPQPSVNPSW